MKKTTKAVLLSTAVIAGMFALNTQAKADTITVVSGDTISGIAQEYGDTTNHIVSVNHLSDPNVIQIGEKLQVGTSDAKNGTSESFNGYSGTTIAKTGTSASQAKNKTNTGYTSSDSYNSTSQESSGSVADKAAELMAQKTGVSASEWSTIIQRESNGEVTAQNPSSSAHGLFQRLGETSNDWVTQVNNAAALYEKQGLSAWSETK